MCSTIVEQVSHGRMVVEELEVGRREGGGGGGKEKEGRFGWKVG